MSLKNEIPELINHFEDNKPYLGLNKNLFEIYEGELLKFVKEELHNQLQGQAYVDAVTRIAPINVLKRIIDRLSRIYQQAPVRRVIDGNETDSDMLTWYEKSFRINQTMNIGNEFFNLFKTTLVQPYLLNGVPKLRSIPSDRFLPYSNNKLDNTEMTHLIVWQDEVTDEAGEKVKIFHVYTDEEFLIVDSKGRIKAKDMSEFGVESGVNPYRKIPFVYVNQSHNLLIPLQDSDTFTLTVLIPVLIADLNFSVKYQSFSMIFGIDIDDDNIKMGPNSFLRFKSKGDGETKPQLGQIKPQVDIDQVLNLIQSEFAFWLNSRGIRTSAIGDATTTNFASGISKLIDEMDTHESRRKQVQFFQDAERELWDLVFHHMHPVWVDRSLIDTNTKFTPTAEVATKFLEQLPIMKRADHINELKEEVMAGFTTRKRAIKNLYPEMSDEEVDELIVEIEDERYGPLKLVEGDDAATA